LVKGEGDVIAYYYLHTNGDLIYKPASVVESDPSYFDSDFVKKVWDVGLKDRAAAYLMVLEAAAMGARKDRIDHLIDHWGMTDEDCSVFVGRIGLRLFRDGSQWCATYEDFTNLQESEAGFGERAIDALIALPKPGLSPSTAKP
jgi:hypothetical protein